MIDFEPLSESRHHHFAKELFESAFPEEERPPFSSLEDRDERFHFLVASLDDEPLGILTYWVFEEFAYIEHFAIDKDFRNRGLGKATYHGKKELALQMIVMSKYELDDGEFDEMRDILYREVYHYDGRKTK